MQQEKSWFKSRGYPHITNKINPLSDKSTIIRQVTNPRWVARHAFFPLLHKKISQRRYKVGSNANGVQRRSHKEFKKGIWQSTKKMRPIHYATHIDAQIYAYYSSELIQKPYEALLGQTPEFSDCISAYRRIPTADGRGNKSSVHFAKDVFDFIKQKGECCALAFDIESFFSNLDHKILKRAWAKLLGKTTLPDDHYNIFKSITNYSYILLNDLKYINNGRNFDERKLAKLRQQNIHAFFESPQAFRQAIQAGELRIYKTQYHNKLSGKDKKLRGILQGLPISAMLANLYLLEFDKAVYDLVTLQYKGLYRRYSDDIVIVCDEAQRANIQEFVMQKISEFKLEIAAHKTEVCLFRYETHQGSERLYASKLENERERKYFPFRYLGFEFYGYKTLLKSASVAKFYRRMKEAIKSKVRRIQMIQERDGIEKAPLFTTKLFRIYTRRGRASRNIDRKITRYVLDPIAGRYIPKTSLVSKKFRGNYFAYVQRAADIMEEPLITKQLRRHWKILFKYLAIRQQKALTEGKLWSKTEIDERQRF